MHELGIVFYIIRDVKQTAQEHGVEHVSGVVMNIGEVSTIVPEYLTDCWKWAVDNRSEFMKGCELKIIPIMAKTYCESCEKTFETVKYGKICPYCKSEKTYLLTGNETYIRDIKVT